MTHWILIFVAAGSNVALNLFLKKGGQGLDASGPLALAGSILSSVWMWCAVASAVVLLSAFVSAIRLYSLSLTYTAVTALAMIALTIIGALFQQETMTLARVAGLGLIVAGLVVSAFAVGST